MEKCENKKMVYLAIGLTIIGSICIVVDQIFKIYVCELDNLVEILFNLVSVVAGIWVTCYLLFLQIYKDSYPLKIINEQYLPQIKIFFVYAIFSILYGSVVITINNGFLEAIYFAAVALFSIIKILYHTYKCSRSLMVNTYIDDFCEEVKRQLESSNPKIEENVLERIQRVLDESLVKEEYYIVQNITQRLGDVFNGFMRNSIRMIDEGMDEKFVEKNYEEIVEIYVFELEKCPKINSDLVVDDIVDQNVQNLKFCIEAKQFEWFKRYINSINILNFRMHRNLENGSFQFIDEIHCRIVKKLILDNKKEWIEYMLDDIYTYTNSLNFINGNSNLKSYANLLTFSMLYSMKKGKNDIYEYMFGQFERLTRLLCKLPKGFSDVVVYYAYFFNELKKYDKEKLERYIEHLFESTNSIIDDSKLMDFKYYCITEEYNNCSEKMKEKLRKYHLQTLENTIEMKEKYKGYLYIPDFEDELQKNIGINEKVNKICDDIKRLLDKCIVCDNVYSYYSFLDVVANCLNKTEINQKDMQCKIFDIYIVLINRTTMLKNRQYLEILFSKLNDEIRKIDSLRNISKEFALYIIKGLTDCAKYGTKEESFVTLLVVHLFADLLKRGKEVHFINCDSERKKAVYRGVFNLGMCSIENNFEDGLRGVSNSLGWFLIDNIKQGNGNLVNYLIERADELYKISKKMDISSKTQTFLLTLFTTVGTYCGLDNVNLVYQQKILGCIKAEEPERVYAAIQLRTSENDMWNNLFQNKTEQMTKKFIRAYEQTRKSYRNIK